jgi:hypothetical protein
MAVPQRILVELQALAVCAAEHHRAQPPVADGKGFEPAVGRFGVPKNEIRAVIGRVHRFSFARRSARRRACAKAVCGKGGAHVKEKRPLPIQ